MTANKCISRKISSHKILREFGLCASHHTMETPANHYCTLSKFYSAKNLSASWKLAVLPKTATQFMTISPSLFHWPKGTVGMFFFCFFFNHFNLPPRVLQIHRNVKIVSIEFGWDLSNIILRCKLETRNCVHGESFVSFISSLVTCDWPICANIEMWDPHGSKSNSPLCWLVRISWSTAWSWLVSGLSVSKFDFQTSKGLKRTSKNTCLWWNKNTKIGDWKEVSLWCLMEPSPTGQAVGWH